MSPVLEKPVDTAQDILDRGMIPFTTFGGQYWIYFLSQSPVLAYQQLAERAVIPEDREELMTILKDDLHGSGTHVYLTNGIRTEQEPLGSYHFGKEVLQGRPPWGVWIVNKKWPLNEELGKHILIFQQVCTVSIAL